MDIVAGAPDPPLHVFRTRVWFDELDKVGVLHNARYAVHAERALTSWFESQPDLDQSEDAHHLVKGYEIEFRVPVVAAGELDVELRVAKLGTTSCAYGFRFVAVAGGAAGATGADGADGSQRTVYAAGTRTIVKIVRTDGVMRPAPWSVAFRRVHGH
jgi:acyl-CoA thioester hydrolase